jgi:putative addiction module component (TIGR02574 family)
MLKTERRSVSLWLMNKFTAADVLELPVAERLQLVSDIWDSIAEAPEALDLTAEDKRLIDERLAARLQNPGAGSPWQEVYARITSRKK